MSGDPTLSRDASYEDDTVSALPESQKQARRAKNLDRATSVIELKNRLNALDDKMKTIAVRDRAPYSF